MPKDQAREVALSALQIVKRHPPARFAGLRLGRGLGSITLLFRASPTSAGSGQQVGKVSERPVARRLAKELGIEVSEMVVGSEYFSAIDTLLGASVSTAVNRPVT